MRKFQGCTFAAHWLVLIVEIEGHCCLIPLYAEHRSNNFFLARFSSPILGAALYQALISIFMRMLFSVPYRLTGLLKSCSDLWLIGAFSQPLPYFEVAFEVGMNEGKAGTSILEIKAPP
jgi:hypothetical protein